MPVATGILRSVASWMFLAVAASAWPTAVMVAADQASYPIVGRYGLAAHKRGPSLEAGKEVVDDPSVECADAGRWFEFNGNVRLDHFTGTTLTFTLQQSKFTPPNTYFLLEGDAIGDSFIMHKIDDKMIDIVMTNGKDLFIQLWMVNCGSLKKTDR